MGGGTHAPIPLRYIVSYSARHELPVRYAILKRGGYKAVKGSQNGEAETRTREGENEIHGNVRIRGGGDKRGAERNKKIIYKQFTLVNHEEKRKTD